jgi:carboxypeptidase D
MRAPRALLVFLTCCTLIAFAAAAAPDPADPPSPGRGGARRRALADKAAPLQRVLRSYLDNEELDAHMEDFAKRCSPIARLSSIGKSVEGRELRVLEISDRPGEEEAEPHVRVVGNLHGDEPTGRVLTLALAEWLCANYKKDAAASRLVDSVHLWLLPTANPDGFAAHSRGNKHGKDLNRNFPDRFAPRGFEASGHEEPETAALMAWVTSRRFAASLAMHEGALVANYPWDGTPNKTTEYTACPDDATFRHLAELYARAHRTMALPSNKEFPRGGTTNGAAWYPIYGSMQDYSYVVGRCMELTLEVSLRKWPAEGGLAELFEDNREAMLQFLLQAPLGG